MSDLGSHWIDLPFWALKLKAPSTIEASGPAPHPEIAPASMQARYEYRASGDQPALTLTWYQGANKPEIWTRGEIPQWPSGVLFVGDKGMLLSDYGNSGGHVRHGYPLHTNESEQQDAGTLRRCEPAARQCPAKHPVHTFQVLARPCTVISACVAST